MDDVDDIDGRIDELMETVYETRGYDFRRYAPASRRRRVLSFLRNGHAESIDDVLRRIRSDDALFLRFLGHLTVSTTGIFRDPAFYREFARLVLPVLSTYPAFKIWHAGCATGEEVYSMAILLSEHDLLSRATIYATDIDRNAVSLAKKGIVASHVLKRDTANYYQAGMRHSLHRYWHTRHGYSLLDGRLLENVVFATHNLATDWSFGEMQAVLCRNVLIYFDRTLQNSALDVLTCSVARGGFLCLGSKESLKFSGVRDEYEASSDQHRVYRKRAVSVPSRTSRSMRQDTSEWKR